MAATGILGAVGCPWSPATAILLASFPSSSHTTRMSATTDPPSLSLSTRLNGSSRGRAAACPPHSSPFPPAPAAATSAPSPLATPCHPLCPPSPVPAAASPIRSCPCALRPSRCTVSGLSGDGGDDTRAEDPECIGEEGCGGGATSTLTPTRPSNPYPLSFYGARVAAAADDGLDFGSGLWDIFL